MMRGSGQIFVVPKDAEDLLASDFIVEERKPSALAPGHEQIMPAKFKCPSCGHLHLQVPPHGLMGEKCEKCGLCWERFGNKLTIWRNH